MTSSNAQVTLFVTGILVLFAPLAFSWWWRWRKRRARREVVEEQFSVMVHMGMEPYATYSTTRKPTLGETIQLQYADEIVFVGRVVRYETKPTIRNHRLTIQYDVGLDQGFVGGVNRISIPRPNGKMQDR